MSNDETDSTPGFRVMRRSLFCLPALAAAALVWRDAEASSADSGRSADWEAFAKAADEAAKPVASGGSPEAYDAYLYTLAMQAARLRLESIPRAKLGAFASLEPKVEFGVGYRGAAFFVVEWAMEPHAWLPPHCHPNASVCTLGIEGEARIRHFEIVGDAPDFSSKQSFLVRETHNEIITPGRLNTLSALRDNIHTFQAGKQGARGIDISTYHGPDVGFSFLDISDKARDAERRVFDAAWKKL